MWPFIDGYWAAVLALFSVRTATKPLDEAGLLEKMQWIAQSLFREGVIAHGESCSLDTLRNALAALRDMGVVRDGGGSEAVALAPPYDVLAPDESDALRRLAMRLGRLRRPAVGRRGGARAALAGISVGGIDDALLTGEEREAHWGDVPGARRVGVDGIQPSSFSAKL
jgi:hypothetical protein